MIDLLVAGVGPAGVMTALHPRRAGLSVAVVEPRHAPIDKACGEGLMPTAVDALARAGVTVDGLPFRGIRYCAGPHSVTADFRTGVGLGVPRTELHSRLHDAAVRVGVEFVQRRVDELTQEADWVTAAGIRARHLVAADGLHSTVRRRLALERASSGPARHGLRRHYECVPWSDRVEVHWSAGGEAYVTPLGGGCVGVALLGTDRAPFNERLAAFPALRSRLPGTGAGPALGAGPLRQRVSSRVAGRVLLVGDAAGYVDALTGEGLALAFACAEALVARVVAGDIDGYERDYRVITRRYRLITSALVAAGARPSLRRRIVPIAARAPWLFRAAVAQLAQ